MISRPATVAYLSAQGVMAGAWWLVVAFEFGNAAMLMDAPLWLFRSLAIADVLLFVLGSFAAALAIGRRSSFAYPLLCVHAGAGMYACLLAIGLASFAGTGWWGVFAMSPCMIVLPTLVWRLRPIRSGS